MRSFALAAEIADSTLYTFLSGLGIGAITFAAGLVFDRLLFKAGASFWQVMLPDAAVTAFFATVISIISLLWLRHSCNTQKEHIRRIYNASDRIRNELQTLVYATALSVEDKEIVKIMFNSTEEIKKELQQMYSGPRKGDMGAVAM